MNDDGREVFGWPDRIVTREGIYLVRGHMGKWIAMIALICTAFPLQAQERPLLTDVPDLVRLGAVRLDFGVSFLHRQRYPLSGLKGDLMRLGESSLRIGVGEFAEFQISGVFRDFLAITHRTPALISPTFAGDSTSDFGDLTIGTKLKLAGETPNRPAVSFKFAVQLPNASNESGLGTDETEFYASVLLLKQINRVRIVGNLGLAILGSAVQPNSQSDLLTYGFGLIAPVHANLELVGEIHGRHGPQRPGNESLSQMRAGARFPAAGLLWDIAAIAGLRHFDPGYGLTVGVTYEFQAFHRKRSPVTIR